MNHFQNMPSLPGAPSLDFAAPKGKAKAKVKKTTKTISDGQAAPTTPKKRKGGDEELLQLDLKRQQVIARNNAAACFFWKLFAAPFFFV